MTKTALGIIIALSLAACKGQVSVNAGGEEEAAAEEAAAEEPAEEEAAEEEAPAEEEPAAEEAPAGDEDVSLDGDEIKIKRKIRFASGSDEILEESNELLDKIAKVINDNSDKVKKLRVIGHTDAVGNDAANKALSEKRAASVVKALEEREVKAKLTAIGKGEEQLMCEEETDECNQRNRRVQFKVVN